VNAPSRRRWLSIAFGIVIVVGAGLLALGIRARSEADAPQNVAATEPPASLTVALVQAKPMRWPEQAIANGNIAAWQEAVVSAEVGGLRLAEVLVDVGDQVTRGQVLARFDAATQRANVAQQRAALAEAEALRAEADSNYARATRLRETAAISEQDLIQASTRAQAAAAQVESARARLEAAELMLKYTEVTAPDDGVVSSRTAMLGAVGAPGAELFRLVRQNRLEWRAELTGAQLADVRVGMAARLDLPDGTKATGVVRQIAPVLNEATRIGIAYVELDRTTTNSARAGMYATGTITIGESNGLELPAGAVVQRDGHDYVFIVGAESEVQMTKVRVGRRHGDAVEVLAGVSEADRIVASGGAFLNDGDRVRIAVAGGAST
jgi:RND family efflux transporter MFP subunit